MRQRNGAIANTPNKRSSKRPPLATRTSLQPQFGHEIPVFSIFMSLAARLSPGYLDTLVVVRNLKSLDVAIGAIVAILAIGLSGCESQPPPPVDETQAAWYSQTVKEVVAITHEALTDFESGKPDDASKLILQAEPLADRLLKVRHPSLAAEEASSDLEHLYGRMLFSNRHYAWARLQFQKNLSRWKHWTPQTPDTLRRLKEAEAAIAECDLHTD